MSIQPFQVNIPQATLDDLRQRLTHTRWPDEVEGAEWDYGTNLAYMKELVDYWQHKFDWRSQEAKLNNLAQFRATIDGQGIHFIHERGKGPNPLPLILTHGWPDSFYRMHKIIPMLTDPARYGGDPADSFDVIVPSIPGYGFSERPRERGMTSARIAELWERLMTEALSYQHFAAVGGDTGSPITQFLAFAYPTSLVGIHLTDIGYYNLVSHHTDLSEAEKQYLNTAQQWSMQEGAYAMLQSTKPQTLAYGLNDSPAGLAAWIIEKFRAWSDCNGDVEQRFSKDELLTNIMIYWVTETINSSTRLYYEDMHTPPPLKPGQHIEVPVGLAFFKELTPPREYAERSLRVEHWTEMPRGGHFAAMEEPELLVEDIRSFFHDLRAKN